MCFAVGLTRPSMYLRARSAIGSLGVTLPVRNRPVSTTPVRPGFWFTLQPPAFSYVVFRNSIVLPTTASHFARSTRGVFVACAFPPGARALRNSAQLTAAAPVQHTVRMVAFSSRQIDIVLGSLPVAKRVPHRLNG